MSRRTQVGIVGAGPAGLLLSHLLHLRGIESIVLESRSRDYVEHRIRAGVLEYVVEQLLLKTGIGGPMRAAGLRHEGVVLRFNAQDHRIDFHSLTGKHVMVYSQHLLVRDLIAARLAAGGIIQFESEALQLHDIETNHPRIRYRNSGAEHDVICDVIAGCDGFHGICRSTIEHTLHVFERTYPFGWLGILADAPPASAELIYANHAHGFALMSMRSPTVSRLYLQCAPDEDIDLWSDDRIWSELQTRFTREGGFRLSEGRITQKGITPMRSFVVEPMQHGRLFLAGDSAHIVPPTGAKGLNLAAGDVAVLAQALDAFYRRGETGLMDRYSAACLGRIWKVQRFSWWMTSMLHRFAEHSDFERQVQLAELEYVIGSTAASTSLAENYVGLPLPSASLSPSPAARKGKGRQA
jgi:p-hydroxybenzoate 3-monooxygenase